MSQLIDAVYENGVLRPLKPIDGVAEHEHVRVSIERNGTDHPLISYCGTVPDEDTSEIEQIIADEFEKVNPDDWK